MRRLLMTIVLLFILGCAPDIKDKCCEECLYGASHDIRAVDIEILPCLDYQHSYRYDEQGRSTRESVLSGACIAYFESEPLTVGQCTKV